MMRQWPVNAHTIVLVTFANSGEMYFGMVILDLTSACTGTGSGTAKGRTRDINNSSAYD